MYTLDRHGIWSSGVYQRILSFLGSNCFILGRLLCLGDRTFIIYGCMYI